MDLILFLQMDIPGVQLKLIITANIRVFNLLLMTLFIYNIIHLKINYSLEKIKMKQVHPNLLWMFNKQVKRMICIFVPICAVVMTKLKYLIILHYGND